MAKTAEDIKGLGGDALGLHCDVGDHEAVNAAFKEFNDKLGPVAVLVNSAAVLDNVSKMEIMDQKRWERDLRVNLTGAFNCIRAALPSMQQMQWGRIVSISSVAGVLGGFGQAGYSATKAALLGLTKTVALEQGRHNITANVVYPGIIATEMFQFMREDMRPSTSRPASPCSRSRPLEPAAARVAGEPPRARAPAAVGGAGAAAAAPAGQTAPR